MKDDRNRLLEEANILIEQYDFNPEGKQNLRKNIKHFMSRVEKEQTLKDTKWERFGEDEDGDGLNLIWDWEDVKGVFGFYTDNGHGFSFDFGKSGDAFMFGGEDGEYGFSCGLFLNDFENELSHMGYK